MKNNKSAIVICLFVCLSITSLLHAQQDTASLRINKQQATNTFFDKTKTKTDRQNALKKIGYPEDDTFKKLIALSKDKTEDKDIRLSALKTHRYDDDYFNTVLSILSDPAEPASLKAGLIKDIGQRTTFRMPTDLRQKLQSTLRLRLDDQDESVRLAAYRVLVSSHDIVAIDKLVESIRNGTNLTIPVADGIELLDVDGSSKHVSTIRPYLNNSNPKIQAQAVRALANDPQSRKTVVELAMNKQTNKEVRMNALRSLAREDETFIQYVTNIIIDTRETADIRYQAMKTGMGRLNYHKEPDTIQIRFAQAIEKVAQGKNARTSDGKELTNEAKILLPHLRKTFPAINRYYKFRK